MSRKRGILIVDDEAILLLAIRQELRLALGPGFAYHTALNAEGGLAALGKMSEEGVEVAAVISDWLMPGMRGDEFLRAVKAGHPEAKLILLSGHADAKEMERLASELELFACLGKPYPRTALADTLRRAFQTAADAAP